MKTECQQAVTAAAGRELSKTELDGIESRLKSSMLELRAKDPAAFSSMSPAQRAAGASKIAKERMLSDVVDAHERTITNAERKARTFAEIDAVKPGVRGQVMHVKNKIVSLQREVEGGVANYLRRITGLHDADGGHLFGMLQDKARQDDIGRVLFGEKATDPKAQKAGESLKNQLLDPLANAYRRAGLPLHKLDDWAVPQPHDVAKVAASEQAFVDDHMQLVDKSKYLNADGSHMTDEQLRRFLGEVWLTKATDGANKAAIGETSGGKSMVGATANAPRQVHYKDFASWKTAMEKYGSSTNLYDIVNSHVHKMTKDMVLADHFGQDADGTIRQALARAKVNDTLAADGKDRQAVARLADNTQRIYDAYVHPQKPGNAVWANVGAQIRGVIAATQLGKLFTALPDVAGSKMAMEFNGLPQVRGFRDSIKNLAFTKDGLQTLHNLGLWFEDFQHAQRRMAEENLGSGIGTFLNEATHRAMGLNAFDRGLRAGNGSAALNMLGHVASLHENLADAEGDSRLLRDAGITQDHWNVWRLADLDRGPDGKSTLLTPAGIDAIPNEKLDPVIEQRVSARSQILKDEIARRDAANEREKGWLASAWDKLNAARDKANALLREYDERGQVRLADAQSGADAHGGLLLNLSEKAQLEAEIAKHAAETKNMGQVSSFFDQIKRGAEFFGRRRSEIGERLGAQTRMLEESVRDTEQRAQASGAAADEALEKADGTFGGLGKIAKETDAALKALQSRINRKIAQINRGRSGEATVARLKDEIDAGQARADDKAVDLKAIQQKLEDAKLEIKAKDANNQAAFQSRIDALEEKLKLAQSRADIDSYLATEKNRDKLQSFADNIQWRNKQLGERSFSIGEHLGERRAILDARIKELQARVDAKTANHEQRVSDKARQNDARFKPLIKELQDRAEENTARAAKRQDYADAFQAKVGNVLEEERAKARDDAQRKLLQAAYSQMQFGARGASAPSIQDHVAFGLDKLPAGTVMGELARFALQFKSVPLGIFAAHYRAVQGSDYKWGAKASHAARFVAYSTLMGAVATQISNLIAGQNPDNMNPTGKGGAAFWAESMSKGGGLGFYGDVLFGKNAGNRGAEAFMGPGIGAAIDLYKEFAQAKKDMETEGSSHHQYALAALRWVRHNAAPLANIWYVKSAFNRLVYDQMQDYLAPGTTAKQERQAEARGASYFWGPGSTSPSAPDLSTAWRP